MGDLPEMLLFLNEVEECVLRFSREAATLHDGEGLLLEAETLLYDVIFVSDLMPPEEGDVLVKSIAAIYTWLEDEVRQQHRRRRGRPQIEINEEQLSCLLSFKLSPTDIARMLDVSPRTVRRRIIQYGLEETAEYTALSDNDLDAITAEFVHDHPNGGQRMYEGYLRGIGIRIQRNHIRSSLVRVDPRGVQ